MYLAIAAGGFLGAVSRALIGRLIVTGFHPSYPFHTLVVNLTGCLVLAFFMTLTANQLKINPRLRIGIGTGFLGAYTTFSTFTVEVLVLIKEGTPLTALGYVLVTPLGCLLFAWLGSLLARAVIKGLEGRQKKETEHI